MSRRLLFIVGCMVFAGPAPAHGQGLLDVIADAIDEANEAESGNHHHHHDGFDQGYNPNYPSTHFHRVWVGDHWEYVPHTTNGGTVVYPGNTVVNPVTTVTTAVVPNALPYRGPGVTIALEEEVGGNVNYVIDGREKATIQAGQEQTLTTKGTYEIRFSRGKGEDGRDFGQARYTVTEGSYHFTVSDKGWELFRDKEQPNLVAAQQAASPSGLKTNALPPKSAPAARATTPATATPAGSPASASPAVPANAVPAAATVPAAPAAPAAAPKPPAG